MYHSIIGANDSVTVIKSKTYDILKIADAAIVASGTATLETALLGVPQVVVYKTNALTFKIVKAMAKTEYVALPNIILNKLSVVELLQNDFTLPKLQQAVSDITSNKDNIDRMQTDYSKVWQLLAHDGKASENAARIVFELAKRN